MKSTLERLYLFAVVCSVSTVFATMFGGYTSQQAGGSNATSFSQGDSNPVLFMLNAALACATLLLAYPKLPTMVAMVSRLKVLSALYILAAASIIWSVARVTTFRNDAYLSMYIVSAVYISIRFTDDELIRLLGNCMAVLAFLSVAWQFFFQPSSAYVPGWSGVFLTKNGLGIAMAIGTVALIAARRPWNLFRISSIALCVSLLLLSLSFTAVLATVAAVGILVYMRVNQHVRLLLLTSIIAGGIALSIAISSISGAFSSTTGKDLTFTGRTEVWTLVVKKIAEHPLLGYGYSAFWSTEAESINPFVNWKPGQAHNGYLEICLDLGIAGLVLTLLLLQNGLRRARQLRRFYNYDAGVWMLLVTVLVLVHNGAESDFMKMSIMWFVFLITYLSSWRVENSLFAELAADGSSTEGEQFPVEALAS